GPTRCRRAAHPDVAPHVGGVGFVAALHAVASVFFTSLHDVLQALPAAPFSHAPLHVLNSCAKSCLQSLLHFASAGDPARPPPNTNAANVTAPALLRFVMATSDVVNTLR